MSWVRVTATLHRWRKEKIKLGSGNSKIARHLLVHRISLVAPTLCQYSMQYSFAGQLMVSRYRVNLEIPEVESVQIFSHAKMYAKRIKSMSTGVPGDDASFNWLARTCTWGIVCWTSRHGPQRKCVGSGSGCNVERKVHTLPPERSLSQCHCQCAASAATVEIETQYKCM